MSHAAKFRKRAVEFEQLKQFDKAITSYIRAIDEAESAGEDVDVALFNKVGDLTLRLGRIPDAVTYYERAVDSYASVGLFNNAIALCNKILRSAPGRSTIYFTLGRICAKKGLRGDASRNFLEYAARMRSEDRTDEAMRALAEVTELMPELTEVRGLVEEYAARAGIVLTRRDTPARVAAMQNGDSSRDLVFLDVNFALPEERPSPRTQPNLVALPFTPPVAARKSLDLVMIFDPNASDTEYDAPARPSTDAAATVLDNLSDNATDSATDAVAEDLTDARDDESEIAVADTELTEGPFSIKPLVQSALDIESAVDGIEQADEIRDPVVAAVDGLTALDPESEQIFPVTTVPLDALTSTVESNPLVIVPHGLVDNSPEITSAAVPGGHADDMTIDAQHGVESVERMGVREPLIMESGEFDVSTHSAAVADVESLIIDDAFSNVADVPIAAQAPVEVQRFRLDPHNFILPGELPPLLISDALLGGRSVTTAAQTEIADIALADAVADASSDYTDVQDESTTETTEFPTPATPAVPVAVAQAVAAAQARHALLADAVAAAPHDWPLRHRFAEALLEVGEREAGISELERVLEGFVASQNLTAAFEIADELVQVGSHRIRHHQKRVELAVRLGDSARLRMSYLDLADALVRIGEDARAHAVYARVLEMDPTDERARMALGAAAPPLPAQQADDSYVDLASWLKEDDGSSSRMRMHEPTITGDEQADFDALLRHFKEGVARSIGEDDHDSHYDLGVAYKEMGLLDDAVAEFQKALRSKVHRLPAYEALGQCFVEQERYQVATTVLSRALHEPGLDDGHRIGVLYLLGYSFEALQRNDDARSYFQRVYATDKHFRDVAARLAALDQVAQ